jgi:hypothetical protein
MSSPSPNYFGNTKVGIRKFHRKKKSFVHKFDVMEGLLGSLFDDDVLEAASSLPSETSLRPGEVFKPKKLLRPLYYERREKPFAGLMNQ